jgi:hypothetical protein
MSLIGQIFWGTALLSLCALVHVTMMAICIPMLTRAAFFVGFGAFSDLATALYFSLVTYTTLGYGDFVLGPDIRIFASFAAVTGLLTFGLSTAFLVGLIGRILPKQFD